MHRAVLQGQGPALGDQEDNDPGELQDGVPWAQHVPDHFAAASTVRLFLPSLPEHALPLAGKHRGIPKPVATKMGLVPRQAGR